MPKLDPAAQTPAIQKAQEIQEREDLARERWGRHARAEKRSAALAAGAFAALALLGWGGYLAWGPRPLAPKSPMQLIQDRAKAVAADPAAALAGRKPPPLDQAAAAAIGRGAVKRGMATPATAVGFAKPAPMQAAKGSVAPLAAPSKELIAEAMRGQPRADVLAVDAQGFASLPDGRKVKVSLAAPDPAKAKQAIAAKQMAAKAAAAAPSLAGGPVDANGVRKPLGLAEASQRARSGAPPPDAASGAAPPGAKQPYAPPQQMDGAAGLSAGIAIPDPARQRSMTTMK